MIAFSHGSACLFPELMDYAGALAFELVWHLKSTVYPVYWLSRIISLTYFTGMQLKLFEYDNDKDNCLTTCNCLYILHLNLLVTFKQHNVPDKLNIWWGVHRILPVDLVLRHLLILYVLFICLRNVGHVLALYMFRSMHLGILFFAVSIM